MKSLTTTKIVLLPVGFVLKNILGIDSAGRVHSNKYQCEDDVKATINSMPIIGVFDFEAAFPSMGNAHGSTHVKSHEEFPLEFP